MSYQAIKDLVGYALRTGLIEEYDRPWAVNELLKAMGMDAWEEPAETHERPLEDILKELLDDAAARGRIEDDTTNRDLFDTELMVTIALCERILEGRGAVRVHGGGFGGTAQAFVPLDMLDTFKKATEAALGQDCCHVVMIRPAGGVRLG